VAPKVKEYCKEPSSFSVVVKVYSVPLSVQVPAKFLRSKSPLVKVKSLSPPETTAVEPEIVAV
jgi:hypothetical protein